MQTLNTSNHAKRGFMRLPRKIISTLLLSGILLSGMEAFAQEGTPLPIATAKLIEVNIPDSTPMTAAAIDLAKVGYTEREFYAEGKANRYRGVLPAAQATGQIIDGDWPYRTRVLVRTPKADKFNGTLVVEWINVTSGQDIDFAFAESYNYLLREGYAVAVVSAQRLGVDRLKTWNPKRYGDLNVTASNSDPQTGQKIDDCPPGTACPGDPLSWDIMTQVSKALKDNAAPTKPLFDLKVRKVIALGESQSAMRLSLYYNTIQPLYKIFDGFVFLDLAQQMRADVNTPAISVNSESLAGYLPPPTTSEYTRIWEVAGASHMSFYAAHYVDNLLLREQSVPSPKGFLNFTQMMEQQGCKLNPLFSKVDTGLVLSAAIESVHQWAESGKPAAPTLQFQRDAKMQVMRDADGKVLGGVRLAQFSVPTAYMAPNGEALGCVLAGHHRDFTKDELKARYGNHQTYVSQVKAALEEVRKNGYLLPLDEDSAVLEAEKSDVAR
ncbi:alpha/beta hydrolase domain-containing protein [uncultured Thiothrix sp.]|uniref:alpha/beta hydrolase domain-containing protein n=1 Tax=uncultured Thiothrix sp. TaxID=223185 RepID=UPI002608FFAB|nr:alpha/beta hydrolase domain-containing protein [uncultured Thiothrix sp.]